MMGCTPFWNVHVRRGDNAVTVEVDERKGKKVFRFIPEDALEIACRIQTVAEGVQRARIKEQGEKE